MKAYIHKLYDEILCKEQSNDIIISGASSLKVIILIVSKLLNQILITITSIFKQDCMYCFDTESNAFCFSFSRRFNSGN